MSDDATWRRLVSPQDALLWWLLPRVGAASRRAATSALRWAGENLHSPADLGAWIERTQGAPGIDPLAVAAYLSTVPLLLGLLRKPPTPERVHEALQGASIATLPPGLPADAERALATVMRAESALPVPVGPMPPQPTAEAAPSLPMAPVAPQPLAETPRAPFPPSGSPPSPPPGGGGGAGGGAPPPWSGVRLTPDTRRAIQWAHGSAAINVTHWADTVRDDLRWQVMVGLKAGRTYRQQARVLRDRYSTWGADFERVAVTEAHTAMMAGRLLGYPDGAKVRAILAPGACQECRRLLEGKTFTVRREPGDAWSEVWPGKTNAGLPREDWRPCVPNHPRCRCVLVLSPGIVG